MNIDLNAPIWGIHHLADALGLSADRAREHTYSPAFPAPKAGFASNLWLREDVLAWFAALPTTDRVRPAGRRNHPLVSKPAPAPAPSEPASTKAKPYKPRARKAVAA
ncbi:hypothetical protein FE697_008120 [Mumia zhuanghuii]|uniref:Transcriptional regulator, AlpA family n=2 Tax=Mumia TaxID=1546255 RepID=A0ABW1QK88_9ACTN|nr:MULTISPECIES: hypothetical protein [Mumia]KAA1423554.1 hypothetical protein FE697_008120 [Mumia zhuanghuii]